MVSRSDECSLVAKLLNVPELDSSISGTGEQHASISEDFEGLYRLVVAKLLSYRRVCAAVEVIDANKAIRVSQEELLLTTESDLVRLGYCLTYCLDQVVICVCEQVLWIGDFSCIRNAEPSREE